MTDPLGSLPPPIDARPRRSPRKLLRRIGFLILCILAVLGLLSAAIVVWAVRSGPEIERAQEEARAFSASATDDACLSKAISKLESRWLSWLPTVEVTFLSTCLAASTRTPEFCSTVPALGDDNQSATWLNDSCTPFKGDEIGCQQLMSLVQVHCSERESGAA